MASETEKFEAPETMQITHVSPRLFHYWDANRHVVLSKVTATFEHFVAYSTGSSSIVLVGDTDTKPDSRPKVIPQLQNKSIISVVIGDYHNRFVL